MDHKRHTTKTGPRSYSRYMPGLAELTENVQTPCRAPYPLGHDGQKLISQIEISYLNRPRGTP